MRLILIFIALCLLLTACSRRSRIMGTWHDTSSGAVAVDFKHDGSFTIGGNETNNIGIWRISGQTLVMTFTNATGQDGKVGDTARFRIIRLDSHLLSLKIGGQTNSLSR